jgi:ABC-type glycerol-3-phosphate transport system substrate-binding protein
MRNSYLFIALLLAALLVAACSSTPTLDASSKEAFQTSLQVMLQDLPEKEQEQLTATLMLLGMRSAFQGKKDTEMYAEYDGWTAEQLLDEGRRIGERMKKSE